MRKKPKPLRLPKKPKQSGSVAAKENFLKRVSEIRKQNKKRLSDWKAEKSKDEGLKRRVRDTRSGEKF